MEFYAGHSTRYIFDDPHAAIKKIYKSMDRCFIGVRQEAGVGAESDDIKEKVEKIRAVLTAIEDMATQTKACEELLAKPHNYIRTQTDLYADCDLDADAD